MGFSGRLKRTGKEVPMTPPRVRDPRPTLMTYDTHRYLEKVKQAVAGEPGKYDEFLAVMSSYKYGNMDADGVVACIEDLLAGHPELLREFNRFLKWDYIRSHGPAGGSL
ncbi:unnamed protein product [Urochloa humidicola]